MMKSAPHSPTPDSGSVQRSTMARVGTAVVCLLLCTVAYAGPTGVIVDEQWNPVPGANVVLVHTTWDGWNDKILDQSTSGKDGHFTFKRRPRDQQAPTTGNGIVPRCAVVARHPEKGMAVFLLEPSMEGFATVQLVPCQAYSFRVTDEAGRPVPEANVFLHWAKATGTADRSRLHHAVRLYVDTGLCSAKTDTDGKIAVAGPPEAQWMVGKPGFVSATCWKSNNIVLCRGARIAGCVTTPDGKPVPDALVEYTYGSQSLTWTRAVRANGHGQYAMESVPAAGFRYEPDEKVTTGKSILRAVDAMSNSPYLPGNARVVLQSGDTAQQDIQLKSRPLFTVRLVDSNTNRPAANVGLVHYGYMDQGIPQQFRFVTNAKGTVRCPAIASPMELRLDNGGSADGYIVDPEWSELSNRAHDFTFDAHESAEYERCIPLVPTRGVKGQVKNAQEKPIAGAMIYARSGGKRAPMFHHRLDHCVADERGRFTFAALPADRPMAFLAFSPDEHWVGVASVAPGQNTVTIAANATRTLRGRVVDREGNPAASIRFRWAPILEYDSMLYRNVFTRSDDVETTQDGHFSVEHVSPDLPYLAGINYSIGEEVPPLGDKDDITLTLRPFTRTLTGRLVDESGHPVVSRTVYAPCWYIDAPMGKDTETDEQGRFALTHMPVGPTYLGILTKEYPRLLVSVAADEGDVVAVFRKDAGLRYRALDPEKRPLANVAVVIHEYENDDAKAEMASHALQTDANGEIMFDIPEGSEGRSFTAEFRAEGYPLAFVTVAGDPGGCGNGPTPANGCIDVVLRKHEAWQGQVVDVHGAPVVHAEVRVMHAEYRSGTGARCPALGEERDDLVTRTDAQGCWNFPRLSQDDSIVFRVRAEGFEDATDRFAPDWIRERKTVLVPVDRQLAAATCGGTPR